MDSAFSDFHLELMNFLEHKRFAVACPRNHSKTTLIGFFFLLFSLCEKTHKQIVLVGPSLQKACDTLEKIRGELEENELIRADYGNLVGSKKWTSECLILPNQTAIVARGYGQSLRGTNILGRPTLILCDDMEDDEQVLNEDRRKKFEDWFFGVVKPALAHPDTSQLGIIGTLLHPEAFLTRMTSGEFPGWETKIYRALNEEPDGTLTSLWPERFSVETLLNERASSPIHFAHEYQNQPISDEDRVFNEGWIQFYKSAPPGCAVFITCDPALTTKTSSDYTGIVVSAVDANKKIYVLEAIQRRLLPKEIINLLYEKAIQYRAKAIGIEEAAYQKSLLYDMQDTFRKKGKWVQVLPLKSGNVKKELRIKSLQPKFQNGEIFFREFGQEELLRQIKFYTAVGAGTKYDDIIDALAYQIQIITPGKKEAPPEVEVTDNTFIVMKNRARALARRWGRQRNIAHKISEYGRTRSRVRDRGSIPQASWN